MRASLRSLVSIREVRDYGTTTNGTIAVASSAPKDAVNRRRYRDWARLVSGSVTSVDPASCVTNSLSND